MNAHTSYGVKRPNLTGWRLVCPADCGLVQPTIKVYDEDVAVDSDQGSDDASDSGPPSPYEAEACAAPAQPHLTSLQCFRWLAAQTSDGDVNTAAQSGAAAATATPVGTSVRRSQAIIREGRHGVLIVVAMWRQRAALSGPARSTSEPPAAVPAATSSTSAAPTALPGSRFYVQRKVIVGNTSRYIPVGTGEL